MFTSNFSALVPKDQLQIHLRQCEGKVENCTLLGYYAASCGNALATFRDKLSAPSTILILEDGIDRSSRNVAKELPLLVA